MTLLAESTTWRLLAGTSAGRGPDLPAHLSVHGRLPETPTGPRATTLVAELGLAGICGRGGAGFPTARKLELLAGQSRRPLVVVNAMEGEPASAKDRVLLERAPHLVLDGAGVVAALVGAGSVALCVASEYRASADSLSRALAERGALGMDTAAFELLRPPGRYAAGEESALAAWIGGGAGLPAFRPDKTIPLSARRRPVLVHNAETLAQVALVARHGARWYRAAGLPDAPGTTLVTVTGAVTAPGVLEVELGTPLRAILERAGGGDEPQAVLLGGYGGAWLPGAAVDVAYAPAPLAEHGAGVGAGVIGVLPHRACGIAETAAIVAYLAGESAGQCGPCAFGLPAIADDLQRLRRAEWDPALGNRLRRRLDAVEGRGACRLPDGAVRLVRSALAVFAHDVRAHLGGDACAGSNQRPFLAVPAPVPAVR